MGDRGDIVGQTERAETPLPWRQIRTLLLLDLADVVSATIIYPFIVEFVEESKVTHEKYNVGHYIGIVEALFFLTQTACVPQWVSLSDRIGRKPVLLVGVFGLAFTMNLFESSKSFLAITFSRVLMGGLNGNSNVVKSAIRELTDKSNRARALSFLSVVQFIGSTAAPLVGGFLSHPAQTLGVIFFGGSFWYEHPYYLPCTMAAVFSLFCCFLGLLTLHETNPRLRNTRYRTPLHSGESEVALLSVRDDDVNRIVPRHVLPIHGSNPPVSSTIFYSLRSLFNDPVRLSLLNYGLLAFFDASFRLLLPLFLATTLHAAPGTIGIILCYVGLANCVIQVTLFGTLHRLLGPRSLYSLGFCSFAVIFATFTFITGDYAGNLGISGLAAALQMALYPIAQMSSRAISLYVEDTSASNPTIRVTDGIAHRIVCCSRAFGSTISGSLFALSMRGRGHTGNNLVYYLLGSLAVFAAGVLRSLPTEIFQQGVEHAQTHPPEGSM